MAMEQNVDYRLVRDARINELDSKIPFSVQKGASQNTTQVYKANSQSASSISFSVSLPSESVVLDRHVMLRTKVNFILTIGDGTIGAGIPLNNSVWKYGSLQSFPLNKLFSNLTCSINNSSISVNSADVLPGLLQMIPRETLEEFNGMCPTFPDQYQRYSDAILSEANNPLGSYRVGGFDNKLQPRGKHPITINSALRSGATDNLNSVDANSYWVLNCSTVLCEPIICAPFIFGDPRMKAGLLGCNNINLQFNVDSTMKRFWSSAQPTGSCTVSFAAQPFEDASLLLNFLSLDSTYMAPSKLALGFNDYPRYVTSNGTSTLGAGQTGDYTINSIQLDKVPDKIIVFARKPIESMTPLDADAFFPILKCSATFANASGLLANRTQQELFLMSKANGSCQSWYEFSGKALNYVDPGATKTAAQFNTESALYTTGSVLVINPSFDLSLGQNPYLANSSLGQYQLAMTLNLENTFAVDIAPQIVVITVNSGVMTVISGSSQLFSGLCNMQTVMDTVQKDAGKAISQDGDGDRYIGGVYSAGVKSAGVYSAGKSGKVSKLDKYSYR